MTTEGILVRETRDEIQHWLPKKPIKTYHYYRIA
jgi:hypothetical protein